MVSPRATHADELKLKDGTKIVGTIVGFEENSFKVKTNYGFAVVQKDQVLSISITDSAKKPDAEKKPEPSAAKPAPPAPAVNSYKKSNTPPSTPPTAAPAADPTTSDPKTASANSAARTQYGVGHCEACDARCSTAAAAAAHLPRPPRLPSPNQCASE